MVNKYYKRLESKNEELDTDDKSVVKKVADKLAKASKAHAGQSKELKKAMTEEEVELKEFSTQQIKQAYGIANDPRYKQGNVTGAVNAIEKIAKGLSKHPDVQKVLQRTQEKLELGEGTMKGGLITDKVDEILKIGPKFVALISRKPTVQQLERMCVQELFDDSLLDDFAIMPLA